MVLIQIFQRSHLFLYQDECSFVSLRDVERAMIVFEYLYGMMDIFGSHMDKYALREHRAFDDDVSKIFHIYVASKPNGMIFQTDVIG